MSVEGAAKIWRLSNGDIHRDDGPAIERSNGDREWYSHDVRHRDDGPAQEYAHGTHVWWRHGKRHRDDGPAITSTDGINHWIVDGNDVPNEAMLLDRLYGDGELAAIEHVLTSWRPGADVSQLVIAIYIALDRPMPPYVSAHKDQLAALAQIQQVMSRGGSAS